MKNGKLYFCTDPEIAREQLECLDRLYDFNQTRPSEMEKRQELLKSILAEVGENCYVEPPLHANWGKNTHFGSNVYANFNLTLVDDTDVYVGDTSRSPPPATRSIRSCAARSPSSTSPSISATTSGSARARCSCRECTSATTA